jgi:hypothetical protein
MKPYYYCIEKSLSYLKNYIIFKLFIAHIAIIIIVT